jgi:hypothetical protein
MQKGNFRMSGLLLRLLLFSCGLSAVHGCMHAGGVGMGV